MTYAVFDIETRVDKGLVRAVYAPNEAITDEEAYERVRAQLLAEHGSDFFPPPFHVPISIIVGSVTSEWELTSVDEVGGRGSGEEAEERIVRAFWDRVEEFRGALVSFNGGSTIGSFLSGSRRGGFGTVTVRSGESFSTSFRLDYNNVTLEEGDFDTTLAGVNFGYFFTPKMYLQSLVQYSTQVDNWSANVRFGWLSTAGTGLFIVYNDVQGIGDLSGPQGRSLIVKFSRQFNVLGR